MVASDRAEGCLLGLACGDALGRPVEFQSQSTIAAQHGEVTEMLGDGVHDQPPGTITDDTEMALCIAESLSDCGGFDPAAVAQRFVDWVASEPFGIGRMTRDSLSRISDGASWDTASVDVWNARSEGGNAGNGSVMRCAPHAIAFRHFDAELTYVSRVSSVITHADPRCQWGCVFLNRTLAGLIRDTRDPLGDALNRAYAAPDELRDALKAVQDVLDGDRDSSTLESALEPTGYVVDSLQAALYHGLTAESVEAAIVDAVNGGGDTDTIGAITGAVAGARFGSADIPDRWLDEIEEIDRLKRLARGLLRIRMEMPGKRYTTVDDGTLAFKERTIKGPAYIPAYEFQEATMGHRPHPAPHRTLDIDYHQLTPATAAMLDWERRAYAVDSGRSPDDAAPHVNLEDDPGFSQGPLVAVPQYPFVDTFDALPKRDQHRIHRDGHAAADAFVRAYAAFTGIRHPITATKTDAISIERMDPIAGATRVLVGEFGEAGEALLGTKEVGGYDEPAEIEAAFDTSKTDDIIADHPSAVHRVMDTFPRLASGATAILDYVTHLHPAQQHQSVGDTEADAQLEALRDNAHTMVGQLYVMSESLRRVAVRHPELEHERWCSRRYAGSDTS